MSTRNRARLADLNLSGRSVACSRRTLQALGVQGGGVLFCAGISFVLLAWLARTLGLVNFGEYMLTLNAATIALILIEGGWPTLIYREVAGVSEKSTASSNMAGSDVMGGALAHVTIVSLLLLVAATLLWWAGWARGATAVTATACMGAVGVMNAVSARMLGTGAFGLAAVWQSAGRVVSAVFVVCTVLWMPTLYIWGIFLAWAVGLIVVAVLAGFKWLVAPNFAEWHLSVSQALPLMLLAGATTILIKADLVLLPYYGASSEELSAYAAATRFVDTAILLFAPAVNVVLRVFRQQIYDHQYLVASVTRWVVVSFGLGAISAVVAWLFAESLVQMVFGEGYGPAAELLPWVMLTLPFGFANMIMLQAWISTERQSLLWVMAAAIITQVLLMGTGWWVANLTGAALGMAATQACLLVTLCILWNR